MEYRRFGRSDLQVSALTLGCMAFGNQADEKESFRMIDAAIDSGINLLDTANIYKNGVSESIVGKALRANGRRDEIILATKFSGVMEKDKVNRSMCSRYHIMHECEASLRRLQTDHIDLYQIHFMWPNGDLYELFSTLDTLVRQGKVRYIGCSKWAPALIAEAHGLCDKHGWVKLLSEQPPYNLLDRRIEDELIWTCQRHGMAIIPWGPIGAGVLSGKYSNETPVPEHSRFKEIGGRCGVDAIDRADGLKPLAGEKGVTLAEYCLAWVVRQSGITSPIIGPRNVEQLKSSLRALDIDLTDQDYQRINEIAPQGSYVSDYWEGNVYAKLRRSAGIK
jgi:aryl-alcohol dehydrogenase-like predicted oxidoreductase